jgi:gliding motility-associated-like protein
VLSDTIVVKAFQYKKNQLQIGELLQKCPEEQISLKAANGYSNYTWSNGQTGAELSTSIEGIYTLQANCEEGCIIKDTVQILNITAPQKVYLGKDTVICQGKSILLDAGTQNAVNFAWSTGSTSQTIEAKVAGNYSVAVSNKCFQVSDTINISTIDCSPIFIPNVFTPNGDGNNDTFKIRTEDNRTLTLDIYNRWGERLYHHASYQNQWNAEGIPDGMYFYQITDSEYNKTEKGWVQVLR